MTFFQKMILRAIYLVLEKHMFNETASWRRRYWLSTETFKDEV